MVRYAEYMAKMIHMMIHEDHLVSSQFATENAPYVDDLPLKHDDFVFNTKCFAPSA